MLQPHAACGGGGGGRESIFGSCQKENHLAGRVRRQPQAQKHTLTVRCQMGMTCWWSRGYGRS